MVGEEGFEPSRGIIPQGILSPLRLPFRHTPMIKCLIVVSYRININPVVTPDQSSFTEGQQLG